MTKSNTHQKIWSIMLSLVELRAEVDEIDKKFEEDLAKWESEDDENIAGDRPKDFCYSVVHDHIEDALNNLEDAMAIAIKWKDQK